MAPGWQLRIMSTDPRALRIYVDGSALKNPGGPSGCAGIVEYPSDWDRANEPIFQVGYRESTNNRMELLACIKAFEYIREQGFQLGVQRVLIVTDSLYICRYYSHAIFWKQNRWRNDAGKPIENQDLWDEFLSARSKVKLRTEIIWKKGKMSSILKEVDRLAKAAAAHPWELDRGFRGGKVGRSKVAGGRASTLFPARGQEAVIRIYRSGLVGRDGHKIYFDLYSEEKQDFSEKFTAYAKPEQAGELHRGHRYRVRFNAEPRCPVIEEAIEV